jgi:hypothetical protein
MPSKYMTAEQVLQDPDYGPLFNSDNSFRKMLRAGRNGPPYALIRNRRVFKRADLDAWIELQFARQAERLRQREMLAEARRHPIRRRGRPTKREQRARAAEGLSIENVGGTQSADG